MRWYYVFLFGIIAGIMFLLILSGDTSGVTYQFPDYRWNLESMKYVLSVFIATGLAITMFWYYA